MKSLKRNLYNNNIQEFSDSLINLSKMKKM